MNDDTPGRGKNIQDDESGQRNMWSMLDADPHPHEAQPPSAPEEVDEAPISFAEEEEDAVTAELTAAEIARREKMRNLLESDPAAMKAREAVGQQKKSRSPILLVLALVLVVCAGALWLINSTRPLPEPKQAVVLPPPVKKMPIPQRPEAPPVKVAVQEKQAAQPAPVAKVKPEPVAKKAPPVETTAAEMAPKAATTEMVAPAKSAVAVAAKPAAAAQAPQMAKIYKLTVGPLVSKTILEDATKGLDELGLKPAQSSGKGLVPMLRVLVGVYPAEVAEQRLAQLQTRVKSAFLLPDGDGKALYAASFFEEERAKEYQQDLLKWQIQTKLVKTELTMKGTLLVFDQLSERQSAELVTLFRSRGMMVQTEEVSH
ncbi:MAG: hypothetical protein C0622_13695 [Desulfuromonas sp.]|nr:MAG: hypothetical protein C0622_13695 [Desulfuromonas sp.]